jgi:hypothetical protein
MGRGSRKIETDPFGKSQAIKPFGTPSSVK